MGITPAVTPRLTREVVARFKALGVYQMAISPDGASPEAHGGFRGVEGTLAPALRALDWAREVGLMTQVNTTVSRRTWRELPGIAEILAAKGVATEGPLFRRVALERRRKEGGEDGALVGEGRGIHLSDGFGFVFVSSTGEVYPSGFLPLSAGNVRERPLLEIYRESPLFQELRNKALLKGKCGLCEYREICGGSRARAWAETGDYLAADPRCAHTPGQMPLA